MPHIEDWEFGSMVDAASQSLTELRVRQVSIFLIWLIICSISF